MTHHRPSVEEIRRVAREEFGYESLRPGQEETIRLILEGHDTLSVMPTGSGKSAIYQIAGLLIDGATVVVSPLIALQRDQVDSMEGQDLPEAAVVNSSLHAADRREAFEKFEQDDLEYLLLSPEQLCNEDTFRHVLDHKPTLFVVDEAHCISEWGHDFRPDYLRLGKIIDALGHPRILALTATAAAPVREEIVERLGMRRPRVVVRGFDRPNIWLGVETCPDEETKRRILLDRIAKARKPGIVYVATRGHAEEIADALGEAGEDAAAYHAGMKTADRAGIEEAFMGGGLEVIVATNAFGMGVDKADVRFVFHYDVTESLDAYYQEIGRGGRDGEPTDAVLLYRPADLGIRMAMASSGKITAGQVERVAEALKGRSGVVEREALREAADLSGGKLAQVLQRLEDMGAVEMLISGGVRAIGTIDVAEVADEAVEEQEEHRQHQRGRVDIMKDYAQSIGCRRHYLLNYFGEQTGGPCGHCDNCDSGLAGSAESEEPTQRHPFPLKSRVDHENLGPGIVMRYEGDKVVILFDKGGYKSIVLRFAAEHGLLEPIS